MIDLALDSRVFIESELDAALQEIDLILNTENTELLGYPSYGTEFESFLWTLTPTTTELEKYIKEKLSKDCMYISKFNLYVNVEFLQGEYRSIYRVKIALVDEKSGEKGIREYQYQ